MEEYRIPKKILYMNLEATRLRGSTWNKWQDEVWEDGRLVGGKGWKERVYNREEWKKLLGMSWNHRILHMPMEWNEYKHPSPYRIPSKDKFCRSFSAYRRHILWRKLVGGIWDKEAGLTNCTIPHHYTFNGLHCGRLLVLCEYLQQNQKCN